MKIAIIGASGAVGQELLKVLDEQAFPVDELLLYGSERSAGQCYDFRGKKVVVKCLDNSCGDDFRGVDFAFVSAGADTSLRFADMITSHGAVMIDNSSAFRMDGDVPLVVPEVNGDDALNAPRRIIANPNCTTIQMVMTLKPVNDLSPVLRVHVATYQAASGAGARAMQEVIDQHADIAAGREPKVERFAYQLAYNVIPHIDAFLDNDYTKEEMKMYYETKKIMHSPGIEVSATCVRVPVLRAHSEALWVETAEPVDLDELRERFRAMPGVALVDDPASKSYPMPLDADGRDEVFVGRLRRDLANPRAIAYWSASDQIKKGAALNAVQIAAYILSRR